MCAYASCLQCLRRPGVWQNPGTGVTGGCDPPVGSRKQTLKCLTAEPSLTQTTWWVVVVAVIVSRLCHSLWLDVKMLEFLGHIAIFGQKNRMFEIENRWENPGNKILPLVYVFASFFLKMELIFFSFRQINVEMPLLASSGSDLFRGSFYADSSRQPFSWVGKGSQNKTTECGVLTHSTAEKPQSD